MRHIPLWVDGVEARAHKQKTISKASVIIVISVANRQRCTLSHTLLCGDFPVDWKSTLNRQKRSHSLSKAEVFLYLCVCTLCQHIFRLLGLHVCCWFDVAVMMWWMNIIMRTVKGDVWAPRESLHVISSRMKRYYSGINHFWSISYLPPSKPACLNSSLYIFIPLVLRLSRIWSFPQRSCRITYLIWQRHTWRESSCDNDILVTVSLWIW